MVEFFPIETPYSSKDYEIMKSVVNVGIDSSLEAFTKSEFKKSPHFNNKFLWNIHTSELPILYRRLEDLYEKTEDDDYQNFLDEIKTAANSTEEISEASSDSLTNQHDENLKPSTIDETTDTERYEDVVFLQGDEAEEPMNILDEKGVDAALEYLKQWHYPGEHMGRKELPHGTNDKTYEKDGYIMGWNPHLPYIGLTYDTQHEGLEENLHSQKSLSENYNLSDNALVQNMNLTPEQIKTLENVINLMRVDESWVEQVYPNGYNLNEAILDLTSFFDRFGQALDIIAQQNPMTYANKLKNAIKNKKCL